jgi:light-regulated signal transduction histidine kinase (bacteriophytochrome)
MWEFSCSDNGIGVDAKYADRIFLIFQRLHPRDVYPGTGIGLALCRKIVEYHGGQLWLDDAGGPGATFRWTLPAAGGVDD